MMFVTREEVGPDGGTPTDPDAPEKQLPDHIDHVRDQRIDHAVPLVTPLAMFRELPLTDEHVEVVLRGRSDVARILNGEDDRLLVVVGPCSVHDVDAADEYARRLAAKAEELSDDLLVVMRVYFEKPRTTTGWKGLINDPHLDGSGDVNAGLRSARRLLLQVLDLGLPVGCEFLDPITPQYISDTVSWGAIGARTTESQIHRQLGSGLSMPVGFKNRTDGNVQVAVDAVRAAAVSHAFAGVDPAGTPAILYTKGNPDCHVILRGGTGAPNYGADGVAAAVNKLAAAGLPQRLIVDASHDNSGKNPELQPKVAAAIGDQVGAGTDSIVGVMLESFLVAGRQDPASRPLTYGQSITDGCMDWDSTVGVLDQLAADVRRRRTA
jgi:3-deoxy-7-phosphoheptulonate synthase